MNSLDILSPRQIVTGIGLANLRIDIQVPQVITNIEAVQADLDCQYAEWVTEQPIDMQRRLMRKAIRRRRYQRMMSRRIAL